MVKNLFYQSISLLCFIDSDPQIYITRHTKKPKPFITLTENALEISEHSSNEKKKRLKIVILKPLIKFTTY